MVDILDAPGGGFRIDRYEASLFDATSSSRGTPPTPGDDGADVLICSRGNVVPWYGLSYFEARSACQNVGKRLCTPDEFSYACGGQGAYDFPYRGNYRPNQCNGGDADRPEPVDRNNRDVALTGFFAQCIPDNSQFNDSKKIFDLSGNLAEWTSPTDLEKVSRGDITMKVRNIFAATGAKNSMRPIGLMYSERDAVKISIDQTVIQTYSAILWT